MISVAVRVWQRARFAVMAFGVIMTMSLGLGNSGAALGTSDFRAYPATYDPNNVRTKAWFIEQLARGQTKTESVTIASTAPKPITLKIYAVDATTTSDGVFALLSQDSKPTGVGAWVSPAETLLTLDPGKTATVPFTLNIPADAAVGDHDGGIVIQEVTPAASKLSNGTSVNIVSRVGIRLYETVPGSERALLSVLRFSVDAGTHATQTFHLSLKNTGNVNVSPSGFAVVNNLLHRRVANVPFDKLGIIAPGRTATYQATLAYGSVWPMVDRARLAISYGDKQQAGVVVGFVAYHWYDAGLVLGGVLLAITVRQLNKRFVIRRR